MKIAFGPVFFLLALDCLCAELLTRRCRVDYNVPRQRRQAAFQQSLYKDEDIKVLDLDVKSLVATVLNADDAYLVQFYNFWCGHCRTFAPIFVRFAKDVQGWNSVVKVAAINCADERNAAICATNGVTFVPYIKVYMKNQKKNFMRPLANVLKVQHES